MQRASTCEWEPCQNLLKQPEGKGRPRQFCTSQHSQNAMREIFPQDSRNSRRCGLDGCDRPHRANGLCAPHDVAAKRAANGRPREPWNDRARHAYHARRAQKRSTAIGGPVLLTDIGDRDEWRCGICEEPVSPALAYPDPESPSLDHVVPLSRGGAHTAENCQVAHLRCNLRKGNRDG